MGGILGPAAGKIICAEREDFGSLTRKLWLSPNPKSNGSPKMSGSDCCWMSALC